MRAILPISLRTSRRLSQILSESIEDYLNYQKPRKEEAVDWEDDGEDDNS